MIIICNPRSLLNQIVSLICFTFSLIQHAQAIQLLSSSLLETPQYIMGQTMSATQFFLYGKRHFTSSGYLRHIQKYKFPVQESPTIPPGREGSDNITMDGKVVVITGANGGLGKELATYAAAKGAKLYMICRSRERAEQARDEIVKATSANSDNVKILLANVGELGQLRKAVQELQSQETQVDCLVCSAGALLNERTETSEGHEVTFASHLLGGSYLLSQLLLPQLKAAANPRVIFVTSGGMLTTKWPDWETATSSGSKKDKYSGELAYAYAKRAQVLIAERWAKEMPEITWIAPHPGWAATPGVDKAFGDKQKYLEPLRTPWQGAEGMAWLMGADKDQVENGQFYLDRTPQNRHIAGPFFTEGSFTKNTEKDVDELLRNLKEAAGL